MEKAFSVARSCVCSTVFRLRTWAARLGMVFPPPSSFAMLFCLERVGMRQETNTAEAPGRRTQPRVGIPPKLSSVGATEDRIVS